MTMENMGELPCSDQQISESPTVSTSAPPAANSENQGDFTESEANEYVNSPELSVSPASITRAEAIPVSVSSMIDSSEFRSQMGDVTYHTLNGRMSPNYSPTNYATLTPLQPLPPISTVSDKFCHVPVASNVGGGFTLMPQNNGLGNVMDMSAYTRYDKLSMNMGPTLGATPMTMMSTNNYQQSLGYGYGQNGLGSPKQEPKMHMSPNAFESYSAAPVRIDPSVTRLHSPNTMMHSPMNGLHPSAAPTPSPQSVESPQRMDHRAPGSESPNKQQEVEEINTKELAQRISSELKRYSIPQAVFAQRVLCRSQGTLSDLLRNPKPWSKLKSGRETFRRMWKWLQEPEFQRMSALRLAVQLSGASKQHLGGEDHGIDGLGGSAPQAYPSYPSTPTPTRFQQGEWIQEQEGVGSFSESSIVTRALDVEKMTLNESSLAYVCKRKEPEAEKQHEESRAPKKPRLVFTDIQRRTLHAIFKETKRPSKEMQATIAQQLGLEVSTVANFFMNARRRSLDKWQDDNGNNNRESASSCTKS
ncbi:hepatocyte nuclear factor 6-like isoform X3 [Gigantopelta aegis]|uniref:hepatocyte nuclear factor 6-like isoform X3 n=1 Tax=Gigantopelta aegis TaxID=1735272 RepID=UPI001B88CC74|nr:hepatocyte nuclear factor 6-like isoform X3 [Gigantopelta aegis]